MAKRCNGEGSLYKRKDGRWCGSYMDESGKRHYIYGSSQKETKQKLKVAIENKDKISMDKITLEAWMKKYLVDFKKYELKQTTYDSYMLFYRKHIFHSNIGSIVISELKTQQLQDFYNAKIKDGYNAKTVRELAAIINGGLDKATKLKMISDNPNKYISLPKKEKYMASVLTHQEISQIVEKGVEEEVYPIVVFTIFTGLRKGEVMGLRWNDIDFDKKIIKVNSSLCRVVHFDKSSGKTYYSYEIMEPKNKTSIRIIPMIDIVYKVLCIQLNRQEQDKKMYQEDYLNQNFVFADPMGNYLPQRRFMDKYHDFLDKMGVHQIRFHDLRHTFATLLIESDTSMKVIQDLMGHSNISTSMDIYGHVSMDKKCNAINRLARYEDILKTDDSE